MSLSVNFTFRMFFLRFLTQIDFSSLYSRLLFIVCTTTFSVTLRLFTVKPVLVRSLLVSMFSWNFHNEPLTLFSVVLTRHPWRKKVILFITSSPLLSHALRLTHHERLPLQYSLFKTPLLLVLFSSLHAPYASPRTPLHVVLHACSISSVT